LRASVRYALTKWRYRGGLRNLSDHGVLARFQAAARLAAIGLAVLAPFGLWQRLLQSFEDRSLALVARIVGFAMLQSNGLTAASRSA